MAKRRSAEPLKQVSIQLPKILLEEIDTICAANLISRSSFIYGAVRETLEKNRNLKEKDLLDKLIEKPE